jgi:translation initiation factor IF-1
VRRLIFAALVLSQSAFAADRLVLGSEDIRYDQWGRSIGVVEAKLPSGNTCDLFLRKPRENKPITNELLQLVLGEGGYVVEHRLSMNPAVNCHGFTCQTLGVPPGLPADPWIDPKPMTYFLKEYFENTDIVYRWPDIVGFATDTRILPGDVVVFGLGPVLQHTGIVKRVGGQNWVYNKLEEDQVVLAPLAGIMSRYGIAYVRIYRPKP